MFPPSIASLHPSSTTYIYPHPSNFHDLYPTLLTLQTCPKNPASVRDSIKQNQADLHVLTAAHEVRLIARALDEAVVPLKVQRRILAAKSMLPPRLPLLLLA
jgi:hypothetical protein